MVDIIIQRQGGWTETRKKGFRRWVPQWDTSPTGRRLLGSNKVELTSIYFSEFPYHLKEKDFFDLFGCNGKVDKVAISPRRNKFGERFGFAKFSEVEDPRILAISLDNILILGKKFMPIS